LKPPVDSLTASHKVCFKKNILFVLLFKAMQASTATRTVTQSETSVNPAIRYDPTVFRTIPGIIKCACVVSDQVAAA
jgi:hypothetical protein